MTLRTRLRALADRARPAADVGWPFAALRAALYLPPPSEPGGSGGADPCTDDDCDDDEGPVDEALVDCDDGDPADGTPPELVDDGAGGVALTDWLDGAGGVALTDWLDGACDGVYMGDAPAEDHGPGIGEDGWTPEDEDANRSRRELAAAWERT